MNGRAEAGSQGRRPLRARIARWSVVLLTLVLMLVVADVVRVAVSLDDDLRESALAEPEGGVEFVLVAGVDRQDSSGSTRADSLMLVRVEDGRASALSIPRNLTPDGAEDEIARVWTSGGADAVVEAVVQATDIRPTDVMIVDFSGSAELVDAVGGIELENPEPVVARFDGRTWRFGPGRLELDGRRARAYARARTSLLVAGTSDRERLPRQRAVLSAVAMNMGVRNIARHWWDVRTAVPRAVSTTLGPRALLSLSAAVGDGLEAECHLGGEWTTPGTQSTWRQEEYSPRGAPPDRAGRASPPVSDLPWEMDDADTEHAGPRMLPSPNNRGVASAFAEGRPTMASTAEVGGERSYPAGCQSHP